MALAIINTGTYANDTTGDPAQTAFQKCNTNFAYLNNSTPLSVLNYGADPTGVADSTAAIQAAINSLPANGGTIYFPSASNFSGYKVSASLVIPSTHYYTRLTGAGYSALITATVGTFDLITWSNPGGGAVAVPYTQIDNLAFNANGATGAGSLINTQYASSIRLTDLLLLNLPTNGNGINVVGNGATYDHEIIMRNIQCETSTGFAFVNMTANSADCSIDGLVGNGNNGCQYGLYINSASGNNYFNNLHPYGCIKNSLYVGGTTSAQTFTNSFIDSSLNDSASLQSSVGCTFDNCIFAYAPATFSDVLLTNAIGNKFFNSTFLGNGLTAYAINETGSSGANVFNGMTFGGAFSNALPVSLLGASASNNASVARPTGIDLTLGGSYNSLSAGSTAYIGLGVGSTAEGSAQIPLNAQGYIRAVQIQVQNAPGAGQTYIATVRVNSVNTALVATISGASSFTAVASGYVAVSAGQSICIAITASAGATTTTPRVSLTINQ
jgi:hypothetical protein